jgi:hypothetical protein
MRLGSWYPQDVISGGAKRIRRMLAKFGMENVPVIILNPGDDLSLIKEDTLSNLVRRVELLESEKG